MFDVIFFIMVVIPFVYVWLFISAFTWIFAFSRFIEEDLLIDKINNLGGPSFMRNYLTQMVNRKKTI